MKQYYVMYNVGKVRYFLSFHDGKSTHRDGSPFWGCQCFRNKKKLAARIKELEGEGYTPRH